MLADLSTRTKLRMTGSDRERYLNGQVTNDVRTLREDGPALYACVTTAKGKLEADVTITAIDGAYLIDADPSLRDSLKARLEKYIIADDVDITDVTEAFRLYHIFDDSAGLPELPGAHNHPGDRFGTPGHDLWTPADSPPPFTDDQFASAGDLERLRIARGVPKWGAELTPGILPPEAGLQDRAISYTKGCYIGQEVISRIQSVGKVNKRLVALVADDPGASLETGLHLFTENPEKPGSIGVLTSCSTKPALALGYVKTPQAAPGTRLFAGTDSDPLSIALEISETP